MAQIIHNLKEFFISLTLHWKYNSSTIHSPPKLLYISSTHFNSKCETTSLTKIWSLKWRICLILATGFIIPFPFSVYNHKTSICWSSSFSYLKFDWLKKGPLKSWTFKFEPYLRFRVWKPNFNLRFEINFEMDVIGFAWKHY